MKAFYTLLIILIPFVGFGQEKSVQSNLNSYILSQQIDNQDKFSTQILKGKTLGIIGLSATILGGVTSVPELTYVGGGMGLVGYIIEIDSYKRLKKSNINKLEELKLELEQIENESYQLNTGELISRDNSFSNNIKYSYIDSNGGVKYCYVIENVGSGKVKVKNIDNNLIKIIEEKLLFIMQD